MFQRLRFNIGYALQNVLRGGRWTIFAIVCIGAGVAAVVALRGLGLAIGDSLINSVQRANHGDLTVYEGENNPFSALNFGGDGSDGERAALSERQLQAIRAFVEERGARATEYAQLAAVQITRVDATNVGRPQFISAFAIDPATFPPNETLTASEPAGTPLADLFTDGLDVVISENLAQANDIAVGDTVRVTGSEEDFIVRGIVPSDYQAGVSDLAAAFFGFAYLEWDDARAIGDSGVPNRVSIVLPPGTDVDRAAEILINSPGAGFPAVRTTTEILRVYSGISDVLGQLIVIMGLGALLIGGVGIINTMLVMVRRRTVEIATLKTLGLRGGQIAWLFILEAFILGVVGSVFGVLLGYLLTGVANRYGEELLQQSLAWRFYPEAALYGLVLGISITVVFGVLPVLTATQVRPAIVLRPNETHVPVAGFVRGAFALVLVVLSVGAMVGSILGSITPTGPLVDFLIGLISVAITLAILGVLVFLMWLLVWVVGKLPAFGNVDLKLALRNLTARRTRTATTLLAISAGMFALSSITFVSLGVREVISFQLSNTLGGNVLVFPLSSVLLGDFGLNGVVNRAEAQEGVEHITRLGFYNAEILEVNGQPVEATGFDFDGDELEGPDFSAASLGILARETSNPDLPSGRIIAGRGLTAADVGQPVIVLRDGAATVSPVPTVGDVITVEVRNRTTELTVIGITDAADTSLPAPALVPGDVFNARSTATFFVLDVDDAGLNETLLAMSQLPGVTVLDISFIDGLVGRLTQQFAALPTIIGILSLLAAAAIMANTVLLSTLERRKQIGVLKAVGLKGRRVLGIMLLENTLIALLGAGLGLGLSALGAWIVTVSGSGQNIPLPGNAGWITAGLVGAALAIAWLSTVASAGVVTQERVTNVLRYD